MTPVTPADIESTIESEHYFTAQHGVEGAAARTGASVCDGTHNPLNLLTICVLVTINGHTVTGESHCQDPAKFNAQIGRDEARKVAIKNLWPMVVYQFRQRLHECHDVGTYGAAIEGAGSRSLCTCGPNMGCTNCSNKKSS